MPNVKITSLPLTQNDRMKVVKKMTDVFTEELGCVAEDVHIRFTPVADENYGVGGTLIPEFAKASDPAVIFGIDIAWYAGKTAEMQEKVSTRLTDVVHGLAPSVRREVVEIEFRELHNGNFFENGKRCAAKRTA